MSLKLVIPFCIITILVNNCTWPTNDKLLGFWTMSPGAVEFKSDGYLITTIYSDSITKTGSMQWKIEADKLILSNGNGYLLLLSGTYYAETTGIIGTIGNDVLNLYSDIFKQTLSYRLERIYPDPSY